MKWRIPFLSAAALINIIYSITQPDDGIISMIRVSILFALIAIIIDLALMRLIKKNLPFYLIEFFLILTGASILYR
jgi:hypothetical protein